MKEKLLFFTENERLNFKVWLLKNKLTVKTFAKRCGVTHQYIYPIINGKNKITDGIINTFKIGGYNIGTGE